MKTKKRNHPPEWTDHCSGTGMVPARLVDAQTCEVLLDDVTAKCPGCDACAWLPYLTDVVKEAAKQIDDPILANKEKRSEVPTLNIPISFELVADEYERWHTSLMEDIYESLRCRC